MKQTKAISSAKFKEDVFIRDQFSQGKPLLARALAQSCPEFGPIALRVISGQVPVGLRGTFYQNGPRLLERDGERVGHWFDADGAILAVQFTDAGVTSLYRYVKTRGFNAEQQAGRFLHLGFSDNAPLWGLRIKNAANTSVLAVQNKLLALWDMGNPHVLDPDTLETLGLDNLGSSKKQPFSSHPKRDPKTGDIYNFGLSYSYTYKLVLKLKLYHINQIGQIRQKAEIPLKQYSVVHDFAIAGPYMIFLIPPIHLDLLKSMLGISNFSNAMKWQPNLGTQVIIVDRENFEEVGRYEIETGLPIHIGNGYVDNDGSVVIDFVRYPNLNFFQGAAEMISGCPITPMNNQLWRLRFNPHSGKVIENFQLVDMICEFPVISPFEVGTKTSLMYLSVCTKYKRTKTDTEMFNNMFDSIACVDVNTGLTTVVQPGYGCYLTESIYAPDRYDSNQSWILTVVFDGNRDQSTMHIYHARQIDAGPICVLELPYIIPFGLHGTWRAMN